MKKRTQHSLYARLRLTPREDELARAVDDIALLWAFGELPVEVAIELVRRATNLPRRALERGWAQLEIGNPSDYRGNRRKMRALFRECAVEAA